MDLVNEENTGDQILKAQTHIWNHIFNFINSMSLKCAIQLGIPDIINNYGHSHDQPIPLSNLVSSLPIHPSKSPFVFRLMRLLVHSGFFSTRKVYQNDHEELGYALTDCSRLLLKDNPLSVTPFLLSMLDPVLTKPWDYMSVWFQNDDTTTFDTAHGMMFWEYGGRELKFGCVFDEAMASDARLVTSIVVDKCKGVFEGLESLVDVGGGTGTVAKVLADTFPMMECTVLDLPHVVKDLKGTKNLNYVGGDMFVAVPPADAVLLKWILHDWSDEECVKILRKCKEAVTRNGKKGRVIIIDIMMMENQKGDEEATETQLFFDMLMMVVVKGKERNEKEWAKLFFDAEFSDYKITAVLGLRSLIEIFP